MMAQRERSRICLVSSSSKYSENGALRLRIWADFGEGQARLAPMKKQPPVSEYHIMHVYVYLDVFSPLRKDKLECVNQSVCFH